VRALERIEQPKPGWVAWLADARFTPCEKGQAKFAKVSFDDGSRLWLSISDGIDRVPVDEGGNPAMDAFDPDEKRDEGGKWTALEWRKGQTGELEAHGRGSLRYSVVKAKHGWEVHRHRTLLNGTTEFQSKERVGGRQAGIDYANRLWTLAYKSQAQDAFDPQEPRDEKGEWTDHGSFTLYHGSQHEGLKKFDKAKIGTGEGSQTYGYGFYLARNKEVADTYRDAGDQFHEDAGVEIGGHFRAASEMGAAEVFAYRNLRDYDGDIDKTIAGLSEGDPNHVYDREYADALPFLKKWKEQGAKQRLHR